MPPAAGDGPRQRELPAADRPPAGPGGRSAPLLVVALAALALLAVYAFLRSPAFRLQEIRVAGNRLLPVEPVLAATGLEPGDLRWSHPAGVVRDRLLRAGLGLRDADVDWLPDGVLSVRVTERDPVALLPYYNSFAVVDGEGYILTLGGLSDFALPVVTGLPLRRGLVGEQVQGEAVRGALYTAQVLPADVRAELAEIALSPEGDISLYFNGPITAVLGPQVQLKEKLLALMQVLPAARAQGMHIDLRNPKFPTLVPRQA